MKPYVACTLISSLTIFQPKHQMTKQSPPVELSSVKISTQRDSGLADAPFIDRRIPLCYAKGIRDTRNFMSSKITAIRFYFFEGRRYSFPEKPETVVHSMRSSLDAGTLMALRLCRKET